MERASSALAQRPWSRLVPLFTRGGLTLGFGVIALVLLALAVLMPGIVAALLLVTFAGFVLVDACLGLGLLLFSRAARADRLGLVVRFVVGIGIAVAAFAVPVMSGQPWQRLATLVSIWAVLNGLLDVAAGCDLYGPPGQRWRVVVGAVSLCLGGILIAWPPSGMIGLAWLIASFSVVYGVATLVEACRSVRLN